MEVVANKELFRKQCHKLLKKAKRYAYIKDKKVNQYLMSIVDDSKAKDIMLYIPLANEVNINLLILHLRRQKCNIWVPFMEGKSFRLVKYRLPIKIKKFGVKEPNISNLIYKKIELAIVPIIGMDESFRRVGFGKGFYDRFFEKHGEKIDRVLFVGRQSCICSDIVTDNYDVEGDFYITPNIVFNKNNF